MGRGARAGTGIVVALVIAIVAAPPAEASPPVLPWQLPLAAQAEPGATRAFDLPGPPGALAAFVRSGHRWPGGRIPYFNAARGSRWAVRRAVRAWNRSGVAVRFAPVARRRAKLVIRYHPDHRCVGLGLAVVRQSHGVARAAEVLLSRPDPRREECTRWAQAMVATHELGHVLGLEHEDDRCATMNSLFVGLAPAACPAAHDWEWRCRLLEADDVRGAARLYGGRLRPRPAPLCDTFPPPGPPLAVGAERGGRAGELAVAFDRPSQPRAPGHVRAGSPGYAFAVARDRCPGLLEARRGDWDVPVGARQRAAYLPERAGRHCLEVWTLDEAGRVSAAATAWAELTFADDGSLRIGPAD